jgi:hypothetical protein
VTRAAAGPTLLASATLLLAGCGGLSHAAFVKRADAVCSAYSAGASTLPKPTKYAQVAAYVDRNLPLYEAALQKLEALKPPAQDRASVAQWLDADRRVASALHRLGQAALRHNLPAVTSAAEQVRAAGLASSQAADAVGLTVCGR